jgi:hypothetical protein
VKKSLGVLVAGTLAFWLVVVVPARLLWGDSAVLFSSVAAALCLIPTAATLPWTQRSFRGTPEQQLLAVMGGMGVRMAFVVAVGMVLFHGFSEFNYQRFWLWIIFFYLFTLALEMVLLVKSAPTEPVGKK